MTQMIQSLQKLNETHIMVINYSDFQLILFTVMSKSKILYLRQTKNVCLVNVVRQD